MNSALLDNISGRLDISAEGSAQAPTEAYLVIGSTSIVAPKDACRLPTSWST